METNKRNLALDVLRGITVAGMILVNNPGGPLRFAPLKHTAWTGCTPTDLVFPFFLLCNGAAMAFSFAKYGNSINRDSIFKVLKRGAALFLVGLLLNMIPSRWEGFDYWISHVRIMGILQRIALCYILGGIMALWLKTPKRIVAGIAGATVLHWIMLRAFGSDPGWSTLEGNFGAKVDLAVFGPDHLYQGYGIPFDPEGLLGTISGAGTLLLGYLAGLLVKSSKEIRDTALKLFVISAVCLALSQIWSIFLPISKPMWTGSYVLYSGGWAIFTFAFLIYILDIKGWCRWSSPFNALGRNPLFIFVTASLLVRLLRGMLHWTDSAGNKVTPLGWFYDHCCAGIFGNNELASLFYALCLVTFFTVLALRLYRKNIIIRL